jgi:hypothetical protein
LLQQRWVATTKKQNPHFSATTDITNHKNTSPGAGIDGANGQRFIIDRTPPLAGESHQRDRTNGHAGSDYWCKTCNRWGNHPTAKHDNDWAKKRDAAKALKKATKATQTAAKAAKAATAATQQAAAATYAQAASATTPGSPPDEDENQTPSLLSSTRTNPDFP